MLCMRSHRFSCQSVKADACTYSCRSVTYRTACVMTSVTQTLLIAVACAVSFNCGWLISEPSFWAPHQHRARLHHRMDRPSDVLNVGFDPSDRDRLAHKDKKKRSKSKR